MIRPSRILMLALALGTFAVQAEYPEKPVEFVVPWPPEYAQENDVVLGHFGTPLVPTQVTFSLAQEMDFSFASDAAFDALDCNTLASGDVDVINTTLQLRAVQPTNNVAGWDAGTTEMAI